jgi:hypothetical protein
MFGGFRHSRENLLVHWRTSPVHPNGVVCFSGSGVKKLTIF